MGLGLTATITTALLGIVAAVFISRQSGRQILELKKTNEKQIADLQLELNQSQAALNHAISGSDPIAWKDVDTCLKSVQKYLAKLPRPCNEADHASQTLERAVVLIDFLRK